MRLSNLARSRAVRALFAGALLAAALPATAVQRDWTVCNRTPEPVRVAIAHGAGSGYISEGWWRVGACSCKLVLSRDVPVVGTFLRAVSPNGRVFAGQTLFCTARKGPFTITNAENQAACRGPDRSFETFSFHTLSKQRFTTTLTARGSHCID